MTKKELRRLEKLITVKYDAVGAYLMLFAITEVLEKGDHDEDTGKALEYMGRDLFEHLDREGVICPDGVTDKMREYLELTSQPHLRLVK